MGSNQPVKMKNYNDSKKQPKNQSMLPILRVTKNLQVTQSIHQPCYILQLPQKSG